LSKAVLRPWNQSYACQTGAATKCDAQLERHSGRPLLAAVLTAKGRSEAVALASGSYQAGGQRLAGEGL